MADTVDGGQEVLDPAAAEEAAVPEAGQTPEPLTLAQVEQRLEEQRRFFQSQLDKREAQILRRLTKQEQVKAVADKHKLTPEALAELQGALKDDEPESKAEPDKPEEKQASAEPTSEQVNAVAQKLYERYGITGDDPEVELLDTAGSAQDFLDSIIFAGRTKQQRLKAGATEQRRSPARAPAMTPAGGRAQERAFGKTKSDLLAAEVDAMFNK